MLHRSGFLLLLLLSFFLNACEDDPSSGSNSVPNSITGKVELWDSDNEIAFTDNSGVEVKLQGTSFTATTNAAGEYTLNNVPPGVYVITLQKAEFDSATTSVEYSGVGVEFVDQVQLHSIKKIHRIEGFAGLVLSNGDTLTNFADIDVQILGTTFRMQTKADGRYSFADVPAGQYYLKFTYAGFDSVMIHVNYSGTGITKLQPAYLVPHAKITLSIFTLTQFDSSHIVEEYADSVREKVWFGGVPFAKNDKLLILVGETKAIAPNGFELELTDDVPTTADVTVNAIATTSKRSPNFVMIFDRTQVKTILTTAFAGKTVRARVKGFAPDIGYTIRSLRLPIPQL